MSGLWRIADAATAAGIPVARLRQYLDHRLLTLNSNDHNVKGSGNRRAMSKPRIYQVAIAFELILVGVMPTRAFAAAALFSDFGDADREPGQLYKLGGTTLLVNRESQRVINANGDTPLRDILEHTALSIVLDVKKIVARVNDLLATKKEFLK